MEALSVLEQKIAELLESKKKDVHTIHALHAEVDALKKENSDLYQQVETIEESLLSHNKDVEKQNAEREELKHTVHDLVKNIDVMMHEAGQPSQVHERSE